MLAQNGPFWRIFRMHGELCTAVASNKPRMANFFVHQAQQHGDIETTDTTAIADTGQHETIITTAPENCTKNAHFSPAKATAVSTPHRHKCAKATEVSDNRAACPTGLAAAPVGGGGAWPGFEATRRAKLAARTARGRAAAHRHTQRPGPSRQATRRPEHQRARGRAAAHRHTQRPGPSTHTKTPTRTGWAYLSRLWESNPRPIHYE